MSEEGKKDLNSLEDSTEVEYDNFEDLLNNFNDDLDDIGSNVPKNTNRHTKEVTIQSTDKELLDISAIPAESNEREPFVNARLDNNQKSIQKVINQSEDNALETSDGENSKMVDEVNNIIHSLESVESNSSEKANGCVSSKESSENSNTNQKNTQHKSQKNRQSILHTVSISERFKKNQPDDKIPSISKTSDKVTKPKKTLKLGKNIKQSTLNFEKNKDTSNLLNSIENRNEPSNSNERLDSNLENKPSTSNIPNEIKKKQNENNISEKSKDINNHGDYTVNSINIDDSDQESVDFGNITESAERSDSNTKTTASSDDDKAGNPKKKGDNEEEEDDEELLLDSILNGVVDENFEIKNKEQLEPKKKKSENLKNLNKDKDKQKTKDLSVFQFKPSSVLSSIDTSKKEEEEKEKRIQTLQAMHYSESSDSEPKKRNTSRFFKKSSKSKDTSKSSAKKKPSTPKKLHISDASSKKTTRSKSKILRTANTNHENKEDDLQESLEDVLKFTFGSISETNTSETKENNHSDQSSQSKSKLKPSRKITEPKKKKKKFSSILSTTPLDISQNVSPLGSILFSEQRSTLKDLEKKTLTHILSFLNPYPYYCTYRHVSKLWNKLILGLLKNEPLNVCWNPYTAKMKKFDYFFESITRLSKKKSVYKSFQFKSVKHVNYEKLFSMKELKSVENLIIADQKLEYKDLKFMMDNISEKLSNIHFIGCIFHMVTFTHIEKLINKCIKSSNFQASISFSLCEFDKSNMNALCYHATQSKNSKQPPHEKSYSKTRSSSKKTRSSVSSEPVVTYKPIKYPKWMDVSSYFNLNDDSVSTNTIKLFKKCGIDPFSGVILGNISLFTLCARFSNRATFETLLNTLEDEKYISQNILGNIIQYNINSPEILCALIITKKPMLGMKKYTYKTKTSPKILAPIDKSFGDTPFLTACRRANFKILRFLCDWDAVHKKEDLIDNQGDNPLHLVCRQKSLECIKQIVENLDISIDDRNNLGQTCIHSLLLKPIKLPCNVLFDFSLEDNQNNTIHIFDYLVQKQANISLCDDDENNLVHYAVKYQSTKLLLHLIQKIPNITDMFISSNASWDVPIVTIFQTYKTKDILSIISKLLITNLYILSKNYCILKRTENSSIEDANNSMEVEHSKEQNNLSKSISIDSKIDFIRDNISKSSILMEIAKIKDSSFQINILKAIISHNKDKIVELNKQLSNDLEEKSGKKFIHFVAEQTHSKEIFQLMHNSNLDIYTLDKKNRNILDYAMDAFNTTKKNDLMELLQKKSDITEEIVKRCILNSKNRSNAFLQKLMKSSLPQSQKSGLIKHYKKQLYPLMHEKTNQEGNTPLMVAIKEKNFTLAKELIDRPTVNIKDKNSSYPIFQVFAQYNSEKLSKKDEGYRNKLIQLMLENGVNVNVHNVNDEEHSTVLMLAVKQNLPLETIKTIVSKSTTSLNSVTKNSKRNTLHILCDSKNDSMIDVLLPILIDNGIDVFKLDTYDYCPVAYLIRNGSSRDSVGLLIDEMYDRVHVKLSKYYPDALLSENMSSDLLPEQEKLSYALDFKYSMMECESIMSCILKDSEYGQPITEFILNLWNHPAYARMMVDGDYDKNSMIRISEEDDDIDEDEFEIPESTIIQKSKLYRFMLDCFFPQSKVKVSLIMQICKKKYDNLLEIYLNVLHKGAKLYSKFSGKNISVGRIMNSLLDQFDVNGNVALHYCMHNFQKMKKKKKMERLVNCAALLLYHKANPDKENSESVSYADFVDNESDFKKEVQKRVLQYQKKRRCY